MKTFIQKTKDQLSFQLEQISGELPAIQYYKAALEAVEQSIHGVKAFMQTYDFPDQEEEIHFYKVAIPDLLQLEIYYAQLYELAVEQASLSRAEYIRYVQEEIREVDRFFVKHKFAYAYYLKGHTYLDIPYYTRNGNGWVLVYDEHFCTSNSYLLAQILAYQQYRERIHVELDILQNPGTGKTGSEGPLIEFMGTDADLAEIVPALHRLKLIRIDGKEATQDQLLDLLDKVFRRTVKGNFSAIDNKNRVRKKSPTPFLLRLIDAFNERSKELLK